MGIKASQITILVAISGFERTTSKQLCRALHMDTSTFSRALAVLKKNNWVHVEPSVEGKVLKIEVTRQGYEKIEAAGLVDLSRDAMSDHRQDLLDVMPDTKSIMMLAFRINQTPLRSSAHSIANYEYQHSWARVKHIQGELINQLKLSGIKAVGMPIGFPMEMDRWPKNMWLTCDKGFAVEAGLGQMGSNRLVLHPKFGAAVVFGTVLLSSECDDYDRPLDFNPCVECGLCLKVCPTGAVKRTDDFDFSACFTHNYRERLRCGTTRPLKFS